MCACKKQYWEVRGPVDDRDWHYGCSHVQGHAKNAQKSREDYERRMAVVRDEASVIFALIDKREVGEKLSAAEQNMIAYSPFGSGVTQRC